MDCGSEVRSARIVDLDYIDLHILKTHKIAFYWYQMISNGLVAGCEGVVICPEILLKKCRITFLSQLTSVDF